MMSSQMNGILTLRLSFSVYAVQLSINNWPSFEAIVSSEKKVPLEKRKSFWYSRLVPHASLSNLWDDLGGLVLGRQLNG